MHGGKKVYRYSVWGLLVFAFVMLSTPSPALTTVWALSSGDVEITEVMVSPLKGDEWIEIINTGSSAVDMTTMKVGINSGTKQSIAVHGTTTASLASGSTAVIVKNATTFVAQNSGYTGSIYTASITLPETDGTEVALYDSSNAKIHTITYNMSDRIKETGMSLHVGLDGKLVVAPATPGAIVVNPVSSSHAVTPSGIAVSSSVTGGTNGGDLVFLDTNDVIILRVLHTEKIPSDATAELYIGATKKDMTAQSGATDIYKEFRYTVASGDLSGLVTYAIKKDTESLITGSVTHEGQQVLIDADAPVVTFAITPQAGNPSRKHVTATIADISPPEVLSYKVHTAACSTKSAYDSAAASQKSATIVTKTDDEGTKTHTAKVTLFGTASNNKYVCVKVTDLAGNVTYTSSAKITGITALTLEISELSYTTSEGGEWLEVVNSGSGLVSVADLVVLDGGSTKSISHQSGSETLANGGVAIIVRLTDLRTFKSEYPAYRGALFTSKISLSDTGETIALRSGGTTIDSVTYARSDGAYKNGKTLHILANGEIVEGSPTPGVAAVAESRLEPPAEEPVSLQAVQIDVDKPVVQITQFAGKTHTAKGQNIFFTQDDSISFRVKISDNDTRYSSGNIEERIGVTMSATTQSTARYEKGSASYSGGAAFITYTVHFNASEGSEASDNRVTLNFAVTDDDDTASSKRNVIVVVRNTVKPTLVNGSTATLLGFAADSADNVIVPVTVSNIKPGDWLAITYAGACGNGLLSFVARNGGHGAPYRLSAGRYTTCTMTATDTAGNASTTLALPTLVVGE